MDIQSTPPLPDASAGNDQPLGEQRGYYIPPANRDYAAIASRWRRVFALFVDAIMLTLIDVLIEIMGGDIFFVQDIFDQRGIGPRFSVSSLVGTGISALLHFGYYFYFYSTSGQTLGKRLLKIRVVCEDGANLTFQTGLRRTLGLWLPLYAPILLGFTGIPLFPLGIITFVAMVFGLLDYEAAFSDKRRQSLHDRFAGTIVVNQHPMLADDIARL